MAFAFTLPSSSAAPPSAAPSAAGVPPGGGGGGAALADGAGVNVGTGTEPPPDVASALASPLRVGESKGE